MQTTLTKPKLILVPSVDIFKMRGDTRIPTMDWSMADMTATYKLFKQKALEYFDCEDIKTEKQVSYILLMTGDEGVHMFNSWGLEGDDAITLMKSGKNLTRMWNPGQVSGLKGLPSNAACVKKKRKRAMTSSHPTPPPTTNQAKLSKFKEPNECASLSK